MQSHIHWDHINGFSFFGAAYSDEFEITIMAGYVQELGGIKKIMTEQMEQLVYPVPLEALRSKLIFDGFTAGNSFRVGSGINNRTAALHHPCSQLLKYAFVPCASTDAPIRSRACT